MAQPALSHRAGCATLSPDGKYAFQFASVINGTSYSTTPLLITDLDKATVSLAPRRIAVLTH